MGTMERSSYCGCVATEQESARRVTDRLLYSYGVRSTSMNCLRGIVFSNRALLLVHAEARRQRCRAAYLGCPAAPFLPRLRTGKAREEGDRLSRRGGQKKNKKAIRWAYPRSRVTPLRTVSSACPYSCHQPRTLRR